MKKGKADTAEKNGVAPVACARKPGQVIETAGKLIPQPRAGSLAESFQRCIEGVFTEEEIADAYRGLLKAEKVFVTNGGVKREPDYTTRLAVLKDYLDRTIGRPIERQQLMTYQQPATMETLLERIQGSPVLRKTLLEILQQAETDPNVQTQQPRNEA
jgi:hypothetical protein